MAKSAIIYDLGTLVTDDLTDSAETIAEDFDRDPGTVADAIRHALPQYGRGELTQRAYWESTAHRLGLEDAEPFEVYAENAAVIDQPLLGRVRTQSPLAALGLVSDATPGWIGHWRQELKLDRLFAVSLTADEASATADYPALLQAAASRLQRQPADITFAGRKPAHLAAAQTIGMPAIDLAGISDYATAFKAFRLQ